MIGLPPPQTMVEGSTQIQSFEVSEQLCVEVEARSATDSIKLPNYNADTQRDIQELQQFLLGKSYAVATARLARDETLKGPVNDDDRRGFAGITWGFSQKLPILIACLCDLLK